MTAPSPDAAAPPEAGELLEKIRRREAAIGVIGLGYVGLPLSLAFADAGFPVTGFDVDPAKIVAIESGRSYFRHIESAVIDRLRGSGRLRVTAAFERLREMDAIVICVPTPLNEASEPDLSFVTGTAETVAAYLRRGQLVVLESTTYPGTTRDVVRPALERSGLTCGRDFFLAYSPEREDPGNQAFATAGIPKVIGGDGAAALALADTLYGAAMVATVPVSGTDTAEAVKLTENIFRAVNIALVNELKVIYGRMGIDIWEVIEAAGTKPFGFMPFYPGPGLGGHCIPIDPFYLAWKARQIGSEARFVALAGEINTAMPEYVVGSLAAALRERAGRDLAGSRILLIGVAYKKNVDDTRESPALRIMELLGQADAEPVFHDPFVPQIPRTRRYPQFAGQESRPLTAEELAAADAVLICTDHDAVDYALLCEKARLVVDTRNAVTRALGATPDNLVKA